MIHYGKDDSNLASRECKITQMDVQRGIEDEKSILSDKFCKIRNSNPNLNVQIN